MEMDDVLLIELINEDNNEVIYECGENVGCLLLYF